MYTSRFQVNKNVVIPKKIAKYAISVGPGPHGKYDSLPLGIIIRDILGYADSYKEARKILSKRQVFVDGKPRKDVNYPVGFMDVVHIPVLKKYFRVVFNDKGRLVLIETVKGKETKKLVKVKKKTSLKGNKMQITFSDGKNIVVDEKDQGKYHIGDTVELDFVKNKVENVYPIKEGSKIVVVKGKHSGSMGVLKKIIERKDLDTPKVEVDVEGKVIIIPKDMIFIVPDKESFKIIA